MNATIPRSPSSTSSQSSGEGSGAAPAGRRDEDSITCMRCRSRKKKCDKLHPRCTSCDKADAECVYEAVVTDRSRQHHLLSEIARLRSRCRELETTVTSLSQMPRQVISVVGPSSSMAGLSDKILVRLMGRENDINTRLSSTIGQQLGTAVTTEFPNNQMRSVSLWPDRSTATALVNMYFARYIQHYIPILQSSVLMEDLRGVYTTDQPPDLSQLPTPDIRVFRLCVVFGVVNGLDGRQHSTYPLDLAGIQALAMTHAPAIFQSDENTCMIGLCLIVFFATVQFSTMNPYELVGVAAQVSHELHFEKEAPHLSTEIRDHRRAIFWCLYCLDRMLATLLQRPVWIPENMVEVGLPQLDMHAPGGSGQEAKTFFHHIVLLRRLQGVVLDKAFLSSTTQPEVVFASLRNQIDKWFTETMSTSEDAYSETVLELLYNVLLVTLYRPSRLYLQTPPSRLPFLRAAAYRGIALYQKLRTLDCMPQNYVHLNNIVTLGVSMLYSIGEYEGDANNLEIDSWRAKALVDINYCESLLSVTCDGWPGIVRFREAFAILANGLRTRLTRQNEDVSQWGATTSTMNLPTTIQMPEPLPPANSNPAPIPEAINPDVWLWGDMGTNSAVDVQQAFAPSDIDAVLASFGFTADA